MFLPIAPFETDPRKSMKLQWVDFNTGDPIRLDWHRTGMAGTMGVMRLSDYVDEYQRHPEAKAANRDGKPAGPQTIGLLGRLRVQSKKLARIGKEVDRLDEEEGAALEPEQPIEYERDDPAADIAYLAALPQAATARDLGLTERGWRKIIGKGGGKSADGGGGGGAGGGYYGGGGGGAGSVVASGTGGGGSGGGGSSFVEPSATHIKSLQGKAPAGNGQITIAW